VHIKYLLTGFVLLPKYP